MQHYLRKELLSLCRMSLDRSGVTGNEMMTFNDMRRETPDLPRILMDRVQQGWALGQHANKKLTMERTEEAMTRCWNQRQKFKRKSARRAAQLFDAVRGLDTL